MQVLLCLHDETTSTKCQFERILRKLKSCQVETIANPKIILKFFEKHDWSNFFEPKEPHDFHEALMFVLDVIKNDTFKGMMLDIIITTSKPTERSTILNPFTTIELYPQHTDIYRCINHFFEVEYISGWRDTFKKEREIIKFQTIVEFPRDLMFLVKQGYNKKTKIVYPSILQTSKIDSTSCNINYLLRCVVVHKMYHFFCYIFENDKWILYNDDSRDFISNDIEWRPSFSPYCLVYSEKKYINKV